MVRSMRSDSGLPTECPSRKSEHEKNLFSKKMIAHHAVRAHGRGCYVPQTWEHAERQTLDPIACYMCASAVSARASTCKMSFISFSKLVSSLPAPIVAMPATHSSKVSFPS